MVGIFFSYSSSDWRLSYHISPSHCIQTRMMFDTGNWISSTATATLNGEIKQQSPFVVEHCAGVNSRLLKWSPCIPACLVAYFGQCSSVHKLHCVIAIILRGIYFGIYISLFDGQPKINQGPERIMKGFRLRWYGTPVWVFMWIEVYYKRNTFTILKFQILQYFTKNILIFLLEMSKL